MFLSFSHPLIEFLNQEIINFPLFIQVETLPRFYPSPPWVWMTLGIGFCSLEFYFHSKLRHALQYILLMMGLAAIAEGLILWRMSHSMGLIWFYVMQQEGAASLQILYWMGLAFTGIIWVRPMFHFKQRSAIPQDSSGETITSIEPGKMGRVLYEGCSWQACCESYSLPALRLPMENQVEGLWLPDRTSVIFRREGSITNPFHLTVRYLFFVEKVIYCSLPQRIYFINSIELRIQNSEFRIENLAIIHSLFNHHSF